MKQNLRQRKTLKKYSHRSKSPRSIIDTVKNILRRNKRQRATVMSEAFVRAVSN